MSPVRGTFLLAVESRRRLAEEEEWTDIGWFETLELACQAAEAHAGRALEFFADTGHGSLWHAETGNFAFVVSHQPGF